jgi:hypothetical protein
MENIKVLLESLPEEERNAILDPKKTANKLPAKKINRPETTPKPEAKTEESTTAPESSKKQGKRKENAENDEVYAQSMHTSEALHELFTLG